MNGLVHTSRTVHQPISPISWVIFTEPRVRQISNSCEFTQRRPTHSFRSLRDCARCYRDLWLLLFNVLLYTDVCIYAIGNRFFTRLHTGLHADSLHSVKYNTPSPSDCNALGYVTFLFTRLRYLHNGCPLYRSAVDINYVLLSTHFLTKNVSYCDLMYSNDIWTAETMRSVFRMKRIKSWNPTSGWEWYVYIAYNNTHVSL